MEFIRSHLFLLSLASIFVIGVAVLLAWSVSASGDVEELVAGRERLAQDIKGLRSRPVVSKERLEDKERWVEDVRASYENLTQTVVDLNRRGREVLSFQIEGRTIPVFPVDPVAYRTYSIPWNFGRKYTAELEALPAILNPTAIPSAEEINQAVARVEARMRMEARPADAAARDALVLPGGVQPPTTTPPGGLMPTAPDVLIPPPTLIPPGMGRTGIGGAVDPAAGARQEAVLRAVNTLKMQKLRQGAVYVSPTSLDKYRLPPVSEPTPREMWEAMVNLWLQKEVVTAIRATNDDLFERRGVAPADRNVGQSAIKHLVGIVVYGYQGVGASAGAAPSGAMIPPGMGGMAAMPGMTGAAVQAANLTQRICNPKYDVATFDVTVVMAEAEMPTFFEKLLEQNFYTILNVNVGSAADVASSAAGRPTGGAGALRPSMFGGDSSAATATPVDQSLYYYGPAPVVKVTVSVEAIFFTEWERPLMPTGMLQALPAGALRPEDQQRLTATP